MSHSPSLDVSSARYLVGPVRGPARWRLWREACTQGRCRTFDRSGEDVRLTSEEGWEQLCRRLPDGWRPDFLVLHLAHNSIPAGLWTAPVPIIGLASDWDLLWHGYRHLAPHCDLLLSDPAGAARMQQAGWSQARPARLFGFDPALDETPPEQEGRDVDVLFAGDMHPPLERAVLPWLGRLARLGVRHKVQFSPHTAGEDYRALLGRARIVFLHSRAGACDSCLLAAARAGALVFHEAGNAEAASLLHPSRECIAYTSDSLEALLEHYLGHEEERRRLAAAGQARVRELSFESGWDEALARIAQDWSYLQERAAQRCQASGLSLPARAWQEISCADGGDWTVAVDLQRALKAQPRQALLHHAFGHVLLAAQKGQGVLTSGHVEGTLEHFQHALACDPLHVTAALSLVEALRIGQRHQLAADGARQVLAQLEQGARLSPAALDLMPLTLGWSTLRVEWERCAWDNAGNLSAEAQAKRQLLCWHTHTVLGELTGDPRHFEAAAQARPDLPSAQALFALSLARTRQPRPALDCLRRALGGNPFDAASARLLFATLRELGEPVNARRLAREWRGLVQAADGLLRQEPWFHEAGPVGDELVSLVIPCHNQVDLTRLCLESVLACSRRPVEVVIVDNGSSDGTAAYLQALQAQPGMRIKVLRNEDNRGFPAACNQGWRASRGDYVVFLNNDTVVTPGWLEALLRVLVHGWPQVGLVGPLTNNARPPQQIEVSYRGLEDLPSFATELGQKNAGKALEVERLTGFCLLARRDLLEAVQGFDERYGVGFFDDDDLCVKALEAGYQLRVALEAFVHHFGSRTFQALGVDTDKQLRNNFAAFKAKWGERHSAGYRLASNGRTLETLPDSATRNGTPLDPAEAPEAASQLAPAEEGRQTARQRVSLCMIVRNEEHNLPDCLKSAIDLVDEVIVVDTGSTDSTRLVAESLGARVFDFPWCDSFAAARNESLRHATGDWIFWLDADDRLDEDGRDRLRHLFARLPDGIGAYSMKCVCLPEVGGPGTVVDHIRLFRNHPEIRWRYRVHEQILLAVRALQGRVEWSDVVIRHTGYQDPALRRRKLDRDLRLLQLEDGEHPDDPFTLFNLGSLYQEIGETARALPYLQRSLDRSHPQDSIVRKLYSLIVSCHRTLQQPEQALAACRKGREVYPNDVELLFAESVLRREQGDREGAKRCLLQILATLPGQHFGCIDDGLRGYKARHNLAVLYQQEGRHAEAEALWQAVVVERPDFVPGWLGLGEASLRQGKREQAEQAARRLEELPHGREKAALLRAG